MLATFDVYVGRGEVNVGYEITTIDIWNRREAPITPCIVALMAEFAYYRKERRHSLLIRPREFGVLPRNVKLFSPADGQCPTKKPFKPGFCSLVLGSRHHFLKYYTRRFQALLHSYPTPNSRLASPTNKSTPVRLVLPRT
ncbi:hypothetical protein An07g04370 [Aspergillus niger]|uniref:Uncharacterized protein n=2 Tax=Aspergillus niger TaxID=5061 RepID=A2QN46_ASPNC|nr:hypothetical protein An07g04370 [Aspergillus niger]CAK48187.1 hypothetical protein An07g04370 [Aspergillus niger]